MHCLSFSAQLFPMEFSLGRAAGSCAVWKPGGWAVTCLSPGILRDGVSGWKTILECWGRLQGTIVWWLSWHTPAGTRSRGMREGESWSDPSGQSSCGIAGLELLLLGACRDFGIWEMRASIPIPILSSSKGNFRRDEQIIIDYYVYKYKYIYYWC